MALVAEPRSDGNNTSSIKMRWQEEVTIVAAAVAAVAATLTVVEAAKAAAVAAAMLCSPWCMSCFDAIQLP